MKLWEHPRLMRALCAAAVLACAAMPALPGAHQIFSTCAERARASTIACSRPPPPITRTFIFVYFIRSFKEISKNIQFFTDESSDKSDNLYPKSPLSKGD